MTLTTTRRSRLSHSNLVAAGNITKATATKTPRKAVTSSVPQLQGTAITSSPHNNGSSIRPSGRCEASSRPSTCSRTSSRRASGPARRSQSAAHPARWPPRLVTRATCITADAVETKATALKDARLAARARSEKRVSDRRQLARNQRCCDLPPSLVATTRTERRKDMARLVRARTASTVEGTVN